MKNKIVTENGNLHAFRLVMYCDVKIQQFEALNTTRIIYTTLIFVQYWSILINTLLQNPLSLLEKLSFNCFSFLSISMIVTCYLMTPWKFPFATLTILNCRESIALSACELSASILLLHKTTTVQKVWVWFRHQYHTKIYEINGKQDN